VGPADGIFAAVLTRSKFESRQLDLPSAACRAKRRSCGSMSCWLIARENRRSEIMFTGLIEEIGNVLEVAITDQGPQLHVVASRIADKIRIGDSIAVNGCCLTVVKIKDRGRHKLLQFDLLKETWRLTNLQFARAGSRVNLERSLPVNGRLGGHFVTGHIDGLGRIIKWERAGQDWFLNVSASPELMRYVVLKGSIAIDGISLTVAAAAKKNFRVWIIPHTYGLTSLRELSVGDAVNLEADILCRYVERSLISSVPR
jgi:riboflavin synthase